MRRLKLSRGEFILRTRRPKQRHSESSAILIARLRPHVSLQAKPDGTIAARFAGQSLGLGKFGAKASKRARSLRSGLSLASFAPAGTDTEKEIHVLVQRLARRGLIEYRLARSPKGEDLVVIEPQVPDYWPRVPELAGGDVLVLSRFAFMRRRGKDMVLESPRAGALFRLCDPTLAAMVAGLSTPQKIARLLRKSGFPGIDLLALLVDCQILFSVNPIHNSRLRLVEGDHNLVLWDFHDLLFHTRSTGGRHASPSGGVFPYEGIIKPLPAVRARWPGRGIDLRKFTALPSQAVSPAAVLLQERHSTRCFDDRNPIELSELSRFLDGAARVRSKAQHKADGDDAIVGFAARPYPSGGASYELELYLAVDKCDGLARGFYHYDAGRHALVPIAVTARHLEAMLADAQFSMAAPAMPQILITITARFGRVSWKYSSIAYALILKHVGVLMQTFYIMATDMKLGVCAIGGGNIDLFEKMTGIAFHVEGPVGQIAIGRGAASCRADG
jgi:SagB-type dehydrogenase family enzyme